MTTKDTVLVLVNPVHMVKTQGHRMYKNIFQPFGETVT